jgi:hypothetical protein
MLTYRLTGTTEAIGINHDEPDQSPPPPAPQTTATSAQSLRTMVRLNDGAALLNCVNNLVARGGIEPPTFRFSGGKNSR